MKDCRMAEVSSGKTMFLTSAYPAGMLPPQWTNRFVRLCVAKGRNAAAIPRYQISQWLRKSRIKARHIKWPDRNRGAYGARTRNLCRDRAAL